MPIFLPPRYELPSNMASTNDFVTPASSSRTAFDKAFTTAGTAHQKGAWVEIIAATTVDVDGLFITNGDLHASATDNSQLFDLAIGASGSEVMIVEGIDIGSSGGGTHQLPVIPVRIPAGTRIAGRVQGTRLSTSLTLNFRGGARCNPPGPVSPSTLETVGINLATSSGTTITAPGSLNVKGAWTQITSATSTTWRGLIMQVNASPSAAWGSQQHLVDLAVGPFNSEVTIIHDFMFETSSSEVILGSRIGGTYMGPIPAGTRIAARYQRSNNVQGVVVSILGIPA